jgi:hypothetical protein
VCTFTEIIYLLSELYWTVERDVKVESEVEEISIRRRFENSENSSFEKSLDLYLIS